MSPLGLHGSSFLLHADSTFLVFLIGIPVGLGFISRPDPSELLHDFHICVLAHVPSFKKINVIIIF